MEIQPLFWKGLFFRFFFASKCRYALENTFGEKKIKYSLSKFPSFRSFFRNTSSIFLPIVKISRKPLELFQKPFFLEIFAGLKYETSLGTCFPRNIRPVSLEVRSAKSFSVSITTVIIGQLEMYLINWKNFYLLFLMEYNNFHDNILSKRYSTDDFALITRKIYRQAILQK
jgi:hypothetical protein